MPHSSAPMSGQPTGRDCSSMSVFTPALVIRFPPFRILSADFYLGQPSNSTQCRTASLREQQKRPPHLNGGQALSYFGILTSQAVLLPRTMFPAMANHEAFLYVQHTSLYDKGTHKSILSAPPRHRNHPTQNRSSREAGAVGSNHAGDCRGWQGGAERARNTRAITSGARK
jgi:hypothetical protein